MADLKALVDEFLTGLEPGLRLLAPVFQCEVVDRPIIGIRAAGDFAHVKPRIRFVWPGERRVAVKRNWQMSVFILNAHLNQWAGGNVNRREKPVQFDG